MAHAVRSQVVEATFAKPLIASHGTNHTTLSSTMHGLQADVNIYLLFVLFGVLCNNQLSSDDHSDAIAIMLAQPVVICAILIAISALQMCAQTLTDALVKWHQATLQQQIPCHGQAKGDTYFAGMTACLRASLRADGAWQYFIDHGLQACTAQLGTAAQQTIECTTKANKWDILSHMDMDVYLRVLSES